VQADAAMSVEEAIDEALRAERLSLAYRKEILLRLDSTDEGWRSCCGSYCDPCAETIGRAVDHARRLLGR
jgi:hypothetical protein